MARPSRDGVRSSMRDRTDARAREWKRSKCELTESIFVGEWRVWMNVYIFRIIIISVSYTTTF